jgi:hypothetical protein
MLLLLIIIMIMIMIISTTSSRVLTREPACRGPGAASWAARPSH